MTFGGRRTSLDQFADGESIPTFDAPPSVILDNYYTTTYRVPSNPKKVAGWTAIDRNRGRSYFTIRRRGDHYFNKYEGYAISTRILAQAQAQGARFVILWEADHGHTFVWRLTDFLVGDEVVEHWTDGDDSQKALSCARAIEEWDQPECPMEDRR